MPFPAGMHALKTMAKLIARPDEGRPMNLALIGDSGFGKSHLLDHFADCYPDVDNEMPPRIQVLLISVVSNSDGNMLLRELLRGLGATRTLILVNGRRWVTAGITNNAVVDLNSIPVSVIDRVEVLRDGASAVYGTDAIGGVINFITRTDYQGVTVNAGFDVTQDGGGNIYNYSLLGGVGDIDEDRWNVWGTVAWKKNEILTGTDRDFTNTFQPNRGISPDTRGTPFANVTNTTGGIINGTAGIIAGYRTGRGRVRMRAKADIEVNDDNGRESIIVTEIPYQVNKARLIEKIAELGKEKKLEGLSELRDESDKDGMRIYMEVKRGDAADVVLNNLYQQTQMESVFGINMVALVDGRPQLLNLKQMLEAFVRHRREVVTRRTIFELRKARNRAHILEGLTVALANIDALKAQILQAQVTVDTAKVNMGYTRITAPIDGQVVAIVTQQGQTVNANQSTPTIIKLAQTETMTVKTQISEADVTRVKMGQKVYFTILGEPNKRYTATLRSIEPAPDSILTETTSSTSTTAASTAIYYNGLFDAPNEDGKLRISMTAQVQIVRADAPGALTIPATALGPRGKDGSYIVRVVGADGQAKGVEAAEFG